LLADSDRRVMIQSNCLSGSSQRMPITAI